MNNNDQLVSSDAITYTDDANKFEDEHYNKYDGISIVLLANSDRNNNDCIRLYRTLLQRQKHQNNKHSSSRT
jgi:hypothetical protein